MKNIILIINISFLLISCSSKNQEPEVINELQIQENSIVFTDEQYKNAGIETGKMTEHIISPILKLNGKIDVPPQGKLAVSIPLGGYLKSSKLIPGMYIRKGALLAVMEDVQYIQLQQDYLSAKVQLDLTQNEYLRQKELNLSKATSDKIFEQAKTNYELQQVLVRSLEEKLKLIGLNPKNVNTQNISRSISIYSPITGFVSAVNVPIGKYVNPSDVLFELINPAHIHLTLTAFEKDVNKLAIGQKVFAYTNTNPQQKYPLKIALISKNISGQNATELQCRFEEYDKNLLPGMFMNAEIELTTNKAKALPEEAIVRYENKHFVFIENPGKHFEMQEVAIGNTENGFTEILQNEAFVHKNFVVKGAYVLLMALKNESED